MKARILFPALLALTACHGNPYEGKDTSHLSTAPTVDHAQLPGFNILAPTVVEVTEGSPGVSIPISAQVLTGTPVLSAENLPSFGSYDAKTQMITLNPPIGASIDPKNPLETTRKYEIIVKATSTDAPASFIQQTIVLLVHHQAESLNVSGLNQFVTVFEGTTFQTDVHVSSFNFPKGPFYPVANNLPEGVTIAPTSDPTVFSVSYTPNFRTVTRDHYKHTCFDPNSIEHLCQDFNSTLNVVDPKGDSAYVYTSWTVMDVRQSPVITAPSSVTGSISNVDFYIQAEDPNDEAIPSLDATTQPTIGKLDVQVVSTSKGSVNAHPSILVHVIWSGDLRKLSKGAQDLTFSSCASAFQTVPDACSTTTVHASANPAGSDVTADIPTLQVLEGQTLQTMITVHSQAFPNGPFYLNATDLPEGMTISATSNPTQFSLHYTPDYKTVIVGGSGVSNCSKQRNVLSLCKTTPWKLDVIDPRGAVSSTSSSVTVLDVRQAPLVIMPSSVNAVTSTTADFYVQVEDPNGEISPTLSVIQPGVGAVSVTPVANSAGGVGALPYSMSHLIWSGVSTRGTKTLSLMACTKDTSGTQTNCVTVQETVNFN